MPDNIIAKVKSKVMAPGSPFRYLRKYYLQARSLSSQMARINEAKKIKSALSQNLRSHVENLDFAGYSPAGPELDKKLLADLQLEVDRRVNNLKINYEKKDGKNFWEKLISDKDLTSKSIFIRFALQEEVLKIVSSVFGEIPYLGGVEIFVSHGTDDKKWSASQLWHADYADSKTIKLFTYLTDVNSVDNGPFTFIAKNFSKLVKNKIFPDRISDEEMERQGLRDKTTEVYGPKGTSFYIDTFHCYHLGSRVKKGEVRIAYVATYLTHSTLYPFPNNIKTESNTPEFLKSVLN